MEKKIMPKFSIVFVAPVEKNTIKHTIIEAEDQESALKIFFKNEIIQFYSNDEKGYYYFKEDFFEESNPAGSIISCD